MVPLGVANVMYKAVMFDMDGLLLDTERLQLDCFVAAQRDLEIPENPKVFLACIGLRSDMGASIIRDSLPFGTDFDAFYKHWIALCECAISQGVPLRPGVMTMLETLKQRGLNMGVATSSRSDSAVHHLDGAGILDYFGHVIGGDMVDDPKPSPEIYHRLASSLDVKSAECAAFEDSETGTRAAMAAGATTVQVPDLIPPSDAFRDFGHVIAPTLLDGAVSIGLIDKMDVI
jgi:HAD superfamily hydrolase (TIGR01509 family)